MQFLSESKNRLLIITTLSAIIFALFTFSFVSIAELKIKAKSISSQNQIAFAGVGEIEVKPDIATVNVRVYETGKDAAEAEGKATLKANKVLDLLAEKSIAKSDIQTNEFRVAPKYVYQNQPVYKQIASGFEAAQTITVKIRDLKKSGELINALTDLQISEISGPFFEIESIEKFKSKAQLQAINDAKSKAQVTAKNLGVKLGKIVKFYEEPTPNFAAPRPMMMAKMASENVSFDHAPQIEAGVQKIAVRVSITYEME